MLRARLLLSRARVLTALSLTLLAAADVESVVNRPESDAPRVSVYGYPVSTAANAGRSTVAGEWALALPLGVKVRLTDTTSLEFEAMWSGLGLRGQQRLAGYALSFAAGPSFKLWRGLFASSHARFSIYRPVLNTLLSCPRDAICAQSGPIDLGPGTVRAFTAEADLGWEFQWGALYFAPTVGFGAGYAFDFIDPNGTGMLTPFSRRTTPGRRTDGFVWTVNLSLLRIGFSL